MSGWRLKSENELAADVLLMHLQQMVAFLRAIPPDKWDWTFAAPAPTPRILAVHAWQWLICDRYHIAEPDTDKHPLAPDPPADPAALCDALAAEAENWRVLIASLTPEAWAAERRQFNEYPMNVRAFVAHMIQNTIYKSGQLATLYYGLGLDGDAPYDAPFPNPVYEETRARAAAKRRAAAPAPDAAE